MGGAAPAREGARAAVGRFGSALASAPAAACALLAPETVREVEDLSDKPCVRALPALDLPAGGAIDRLTVAGHSGEAVLAGDTIFLALFDDGWRVIAAGCTAQGSDPQRPYDCTVKAG